MATETPEPGIYEDVAFADYLAWDAISNSKLSLMAKSARHYKLGFFTEPTKPMRLGQLYHCGVLEPRAFAARYAVCPDFHLYAENSTVDGDYTTSKNTKFVKNSEREFREMAEGREVVPKEWFNDMRTVVEELARNANAHQILNDSGPSEVSIIWEESDLLFKARIDKVAENRRAIADLKSTADIMAFTRTIGKFGYHRQMAHYQTGWKELTGDTLSPWLIPVESSSPFTCLAAPIGDDSLVAGHAERRRLIEDLQVCLDTDTWPGRPNPKHWNVPEYFLNQEPVALSVNGHSIEV